MFYLPLVISLFTLFFTFFLIRKIRQAPLGSDRTIAISNYIREGVRVYLKRQSKSIALVALFLFSIFWIIFGFPTASGFLLGAIFSALASFIGIMVSAKTNVRVLEIAKEGRAPALNLAFRGGLATGFLVMGLGLLSVSGFYLLVQELKPLIALGFGASLISVFSRLGGGIYTKAAAGGVKDDARNPAVIAGLVGDNVGDGAGIIADLFETYLVTLVATMVLGALIFPAEPIILQLPLFLGAAAILSSIIISFWVKLKGDQTMTSALYKGLMGSALLSALGFIFIIKNSVSLIGLSFWQLYLPALMGLIIAGGTLYRSAKSIAEISLPAILISLGILVSFWLGGMMGLAVAVVSTLSLVGMIVALGIYSSIIDNTSGIAKMAGLSEETREVTDSLDGGNNTIKAVTKAYAITSAALAALVLFSAYTQEIQALGGKILFYLGDYKVLVGLFLGGLLPYLFASYLMQAVGRAGKKLAKEVRRQFKEIKGLKEGEQKPEYGKCVDTVTKSAIIEMAKPVLIPVVASIFVGFILGPEALGGLLIGSIVTGIFVAISMTGPTITPMIKVLNIVALLIVGFLV